MRRRPPAALVAIVAVALIARVAAIAATPDFAPIFDAADYERHALSIAEGEGFGSSQYAPGPSAFRPPVYPAALAAVDVVGGDRTAKRLLGVIFGVVSVVLIFLIADRLWNRRTAIVAGGIAAVFPPLVFLNLSLLSEALFVPLALAAVLTTLEYRADGRWRWLVITGLLCGLAILTRTAGAPLALALALGVWTARPRFSRTALMAPAVLVLVAVLTLAPWVIRNTITFDRWVGLSTAGGYALAGTYNEESRARGSKPGQPFSPNVLRIYDPVLRDRSLDEAESTGELNDQAMAYIREHPGYVAETMAWNVLRVFEIHSEADFEQRFATSQMQAAGVEELNSPGLFLGSLYVVMLMALVGVGVLALRPRWRTPLFVWLTPILLLLPALAIYGLPRYRAPIDPFLVLLAAVAAVAAFEAWADRDGAGDGESSAAPAVTRS